jgi:hypothetical protein
MKVRRNRFRSTLKTPYAPMKLENIIRVLAGTMVLGSLALAQYASPNWLWLTAFVGFNLLQSAFTGFCPAESLFRKLGIGKCGGECGRG